MSDFLGVFYSFRIEEDLVNPLLAGADAIRDEVVTNHKTLFTFGARKLQGTTEYLSIGLIYAYLITTQQDIKERFQSTFRELNVLAFMEAVGNDVHLIATSFERFKYMSRTVNQMILIRRFIDVTCFEPPSHIVSFCTEMCEGFLKTRLA